GGPARQQEDRSGAQQGQGRGKGKQAGGTHGRASRRGAKDGQRGRTRTAGRGKGPGRATRQAPLVRGFVGTTGALSAGMKKVRQEGAQRDASCGAGERVGVGDRRRPPGFARPPRPDCSTTLILPRFFRKVQPSLRKRRGTRWQRWGRVGIPVTTALPPD